MSPGRMEDLQQPEAVGWEDWKPSHPWPCTVFSSLPLGMAEDGILMGFSVDTLCAPNHGLGMIPEGHISAQ